MLSSWLLLLVLLLLCRWLPCLRSICCAVRGLRAALPSPLPALLLYAAAVRRCRTGEACRSVGESASSSSGLAKAPCSREAKRSGGGGRAGSVSLSGRAAPRREGRVVTGGNGMVGTIAYQHFGWYRARSGREILFGSVPRRICFLVLDFMALLSLLIAGICKRLVCCYHAGSGRDCIG